MSICKTSSSSSAPLFPSWRGSSRSGYLGSRVRTIPKGPEVALTSII